ncbi:hypothetical protein BN2476_680046 [Paraburkholderia piptadeniae]|uniref:Uncharacterized protein n=1 Tax=Paraburkholderia piptadeniae TaxID=1701573 RepID=A0A1N7SPH0_9BURK|nr:hypothetical protein BN2476_680046 [Paraburkholderia piptadeniae]
MNAPVVPLKNLATLSEQAVPPLRSLKIYRPACVCVAKIQCVFATVALSFYAAVCLAEQSTVLPVEQADLPVYHVGDTWSFGSPESAYPASVTRHTVVEVTPQQTRMSVQHPHGEPHEHNFDSTGNVTVDGSYSYQPNSGLMRFPLKVGESWSTDYTVTRRERSSLWMTSHVSVEGSEVVHVKAGDFSLEPVIGQCTCFA